MARAERRLEEMRRAAVHPGEGRWIPSKTLEEFVRSLAQPRQMMLMVPAGEAVDEVLDRDTFPLLLNAERGWRAAVQAAFDSGIPIPAMAATLAYFDGYRAAVLPQNLTQAQRDFFGAHTYQRVDEPDAAPVHTDWRQLIDESSRPSQET